MSPRGSRKLVVARPERDPAIEYSVVVPAYDEALRLPAVLAALRQHVNTSKTEIVIVDDGSHDDTASVAEVAADWAEHLVVLRCEQNRGKGAAVRRGVAAARGTAIGFIDADNATDLSAITPMFAALGGHVGAVFGSRHAPGSQVDGAPMLRGVMGRVFNNVVQLAAGTSIRDTQCGAKVFQGPAARLVFGVASVDGFAFDVEILRRLLQLGFGVVEYPVKWRHVNGTKITVSTPLRMLADIARIRFSRQVPPCEFVDTTWSEALERHADPLLSGDLHAGDPVRVLLPFGPSQALSMLVEGGDRGQSRTWLQLSGTAAS